MAGLMAEASGALIAAEAAGDNAIREAGNEFTTLGNEKTAALLRLALEQGRVRLLSLPVLDMKGKLIHRECLMELLLDGTDAWRPVRHFQQVAEEYQLMPRMDLAVLELTLEKLRQDTSLPGLAISLSALSISDKSFRVRLLGLLGENRSLAGRLWLEVPETTAAKHLESLREFVAEVRQAGGRVGLGNFGRHFNQADVLHDLGLDFLKVDSSFIRGLQYSTANQIFLKSLAAVAHKMGMQVYGEGVIDRAELAALESTGFDGASGAAVREQT